MQKLRSAVSLTFEHLADGVKRATPNDAVDASSSNSSGGGATPVISDVTSIDGIANAPTASEDERRLLEDLKKDLKKVGAFSVGPLSQRLFKYSFFFAKTDHVCYVWCSLKKNLFGRHYNHVAR